MPVRATTTARPTMAAAMPWPASCANTWRATSRSAAGVSARLGCPAARRARPLGAGRAVGEEDSPRDDAGGDARAGAPDVAGRAGVDRGDGEIRDRIRA